MNLCAFFLMVVGLITCIDSRRFPPKPRPPPPRPPDPGGQNEPQWTDAVDLQLSGYEKIRYGLFSYKFSGFVKGSFTYGEWTSKAQYVDIVIEYCPKNRDCSNTVAWSRLCTMFRYPNLPGPNCNSKPMSDFPCYCYGLKSAEIKFYPTRPNSLYRINLVPFPSVDYPMPTSNHFDNSVMPKDDYGSAATFNLDLIEIDSPFLFSGGHSCLSRSGQQQLTPDRIFVGIGGLASFILSRLLAANY